MEGKPMMPSEDRFLTTSCSESCPVNKEYSWQWEPKGQNHSSKMDWMALSLKAESHLLERQHTILDSAKIDMIPLWVWLVGTWSWTTHWSLVWLFHNFTRNRPFVWCHFVQMRCTLRNLSAIFLSSFGSLWYTSYTEVNMRTEIFDGTLTRCFETFV